MRQSQQRLSLACFSLVSSAACCRLFAVLSLLVCPVTVAQAADSLPSDEHAAQLVREHIGRVVSYVQNGDAESLTLEFIPDGIRSLSTAKSPVAGRTAIRRQIEGTLEQYRERRFEKLNGEIPAERFTIEDLKIESTKTQIRDEVHEREWNVDLDAVGDIVKYIRDLAQ